MAGPGQARRGILRPGGEHGRVCSTAAAPTAVKAPYAPHTGSFAFRSAPPTGAGLKVVQGRRAQFIGCEQRSWARTGFGHTPHCALAYRSGAARSQPASSKVALPCEKGAASRVRMWAPPPPPRRPTTKGQCLPFGQPVRAVGGPKGWGPEGTTPRSSLMGLKICRAHAMCKQHRCHKLMPWPGLWRSHRAALTVYSAE